jgi:Zn-dependent protease/CBS domain-containing protein
MATEHMTRDPWRPGPEARAGRAGRETGVKRWAWKLGSVSGIDIYVHATFWLLVIWVALTHLSDGGWEAAGMGVALILSVFAIVVLHELGHALVARRFGVRTRDITLYPIGGIASLERIPEKPIQEFLVALAGPAVNVALGVVLYVAAALLEGPLDAGALAVVGGPFLTKLFFINLTIVVFNLIPAFPMDGGRVLRALLALRMDYTRATEVAARVGQGLAFLFGLIGLFSSPMLVFIALFVWLGAQQEYSLARLRSALEGIPVRSAMITDFRTLAPGDLLSHAVEIVIAGSQHDFPVVENGKLVGLLTRVELARGLAQEGSGALVANFMDRNPRVVDPSEMVTAVIPRIQQNDRGSLLVVDKQGTLVGMLTAENVGELVMLKGALHGQGRGGRDAFAPG